MVNQSRDQLHKQIKTHRQSSLVYTDVNTINKIKNKSNHNETYNENVAKIKKLEIELKCLIDNFNSQEEKKQMEKIRQTSHQLQWLIYEWKKSHATSWYFSETSFKCPSVMPHGLGHLLKLATSPLDQTYFKIKHLKQILAEPSKCLRVNLKQSCSEPIKNKIFRQDILPLNLKRIICVNFNGDHSLSLESYDGQTGECLTRVCAHERITYFPICCAYGDYFCVAFTADKESRGEQCCHENDLIG